MGRLACKNSINWQFAEKLSVLRILIPHLTADAEIIGGCVSGKGHEILVEMAVMPLISYPCGWVRSFLSTQSGRGALPRVFANWVEHRRTSSTSRAVCAVRVATSDWYSRSERTDILVIPPSLVLDQSSSRFRRMTRVC